MGVVDGGWKEVLRATYRLSCVATRIPSVCSLLLAGREGRFGPVDRVAMDGLACWSASACVGAGSKCGEREEGPREAGARGVSEGSM